MKTKPNLFLIGASKCGTTFLHDLLACHPEIFMSRKKELHFFTNNECSDPNVESSFLNHFHGSESKRYRGESTPTYSETTYFPDVPRRISEFSSDAKLIYVVRSPFDRLRSVYKQALSTGHWVEKKYYHKKMPIKFSDALFDYPPFVEATKYYTHLNNYLRYFPASSIKVILFEKLVAETDETLKEIFRFLELDDNVDIDVGIAERNESKDKKIYVPSVAMVRKVLPRWLVKSVSTGTKASAVRFLRFFSRRRSIPVAELNLQASAKVSAILRSEVEGIYSYIGVSDDPWHFLSSSSERVDER